MKYLRKYISTRSHIIEICLEKRGSSTIELALWDAVILGLGAVSDGGEDSTGVLGKSLAKLNAPLIKTIAVKNESFNGNSVLVDGEQLTTLESVQGTEEEKTERWLVTCEEFVLEEVVRDTLGLQRGNVFANGECIWLCKEIRHEFFVV